MRSAPLMPSRDLHLIADSVRVDERRASSRSRRYVRLRGRPVRAGWSTQHGMTSSDSPPYAPQDCWGREPAEWQYLPRGDLASVPATERVDQQPSARGPGTWNRRYRPDVGLADHPGDHDAEPVIRHSAGWQRTWRCRGRGVRVLRPQRNARRGASGSTAGRCTGARTTPVAASTPGRASSALGKDVNTPSSAPRLSAG